MELKFCSEIVPSRFPFYLCRSFSCFLLIGHSLFLCRIFFFLTSLFSFGLPLPSVYTAEPLYLSALFVNNNDSIEPSDRSAFESSFYFIYFTLLILFDRYSMFNFRSYYSIKFTCMLLHRRIISPP